MAFIPEHNLILCRLWISIAMSKCLVFGVNKTEHNAFVLILSFCIFSNFSQQRVCCYSVVDDDGRCRRIKKDWKHHFLLTTKCDECIYKKYVFGLRYENNARVPLWFTRCTNGKRILESWNCFTCTRLHALALIGSTLMICTNRENRRKHEYANRIDLLTSTRVRVPVS